MAKGPLPAVFRDLSREERAALKACFEFAELDAGVQLMTAGERDPSLLVLMDGEMVRDRPGLPKETVSAGAVVGATSLFAEQARRATVTTQSTCRIAVLTERGLSTLRAQEHRVVERLERGALEQAARWLREATEAVAERAVGVPTAALMPERTLMKKVVAAAGGGSGTVRDAPKVKVAKALSFSRLFRHVHDQTLLAIAPAFRPLHANKGHIFCLEGQIGHKMYVVASGRVEVLVKASKTRVEPMEALTSGAAFGMAALVARSAPRMASCVASKPTYALELSRRKWWALVQQSDRAGSVMRVATIRSLAEKLTYTEGRLARADSGR